ncbi:magnesium/cobalt transporter CorA [Halosimplex rubrum]|uniref:Magnesium transport protein CorA n=1 Tax=Halosimplex rubrum TaxID=869889 RepID=A0A7D5P4Y1_9EURY|nr:magnesium/cobalt transporter CorA [Halosimplex rubrum]QLH77582.1 magnesium/cobalt transporter CorA [Halosimplex rubrum]
MTTALVYRADEVTEYDDLAAARAARGTTWVHAAGVDRAEMERVADAFGIHSLSVEDVFNGVRPKTEEYDDYTLVVVKRATLRGGETTFDEEISDVPVGVFVGSDWLVTLTPGPADPIDRVRQAVHSGDERLLHRGADFTAYRIIDVIVDEYFALLDEIEDDIETVEDAVTTATDIETLEAINSVRRELLSFRKLAWPTREAVGVLARGDPAQVDEETEKYFRDVYDHLVQLVDLTETYRDLASGARDIYLNTLSQSTNEVMKVLTVVATIFIPLTFVVGVYGMNFGSSPYNMPELAWPYAYPAVMVGMLLVALVMLSYFRGQDYI